MPRVISGRWKGRRLATPPGSNTRPTSDRVRESIFTKLAHENIIEDAVVLDLFAGAGTLALEALSRGAKKAVLVDSSAQAVSCIQRNIDLVEADARVIAADAAELLRRDSAEQYNLVFYDPPYDYPSGKVERDMKNLLQGWLRPDALVVVEQSARAATVQWPTPFSDVQVKEYGETRVSFADTYVAVDGESAGC